MLKISLFEFFVRGIPEEFMAVLAVYAFAKMGINLKKFLLSGTLYWLFAYLIRFLPIQYGIHSILNVIALIIITSYINKVDIIQSIRATIIVFILEFAIEGINLLIMELILGNQLNKVMKNPVLYTLYGTPSIILFAIIVLTYYLRLSKRKELKYI